MTQTIDYNAIRALQAKCYQAAADKGFHDDRPTTAAALVPYQGNKMMLMVSELVEAHDELRSGRKVTETYYPERGDVASLGRIMKPEGVPSELADTVIRILDFCGAEGIDLASIIEIKLGYNATRGYKHGKTF